MAYDHTRHTNMRKSKNNAREIAVDNEGIIPRKVALFITVPGIPDIIEALKSGLINRRTVIIAVNHCRTDRNSAYDEKIGNQIKRNLTSLGSKHVLINDFFESGKGLQMISDASTRFGKIDYAFLDLCGLATPAFCAAVNKMQDSLAPKARIVLTVCTRARNPQIVTSWYNAFFGELDSPSLELFSTLTSGEWISQLFYAGLSKTEKNKLLQRLSAITNFIWQWQAVSASFDKFTTKVTSSMHYCDMTPMGLVVFDITKKDGGNNLFSYIREICQSAKSPSRSDNSELTAGQKAWITRRKNQNK